MTHIEWARFPEEIPPEAAPLMVVRENYELASPVYFSGEYFVVDMRYTCCCALPFDDVKYWTLLSEYIEPFKQDELNNDIIAFATELEKEVDPVLQWQVRIRSVAPE